MPRASAAPRRRRLARGRARSREATTEKLVLQYLGTALADHGGELPVARDMPRGVLGVPLEKLEAARRYMPQQDELAQASRLRPRLRRPGAQAPRQARRRLGVACPRRRAVTSREPRTTSRVRLTRGRAKPRARCEGAPREPGQPDMSRLVHPVRCHRRNRRHHPARPSWAAAGDQPPHGAARQQQEVEAEGSGGVGRTATLWSFAGFGSARRSRRPTGDAPTPGSGVEAPGAGRQATACLSGWVQSCGYWCGRGRGAAWTNPSRRLAGTSIRSVASRRDGQKHVDHRWRRLTDHAFAFYLPDPRDGAARIVARLRRDFQDLDGHFAIYTCR